MSAGKLGEICSECGKPIRPIHNPEDPSVFIGDEHGDWILVNGKYLTPKEVEALGSEVQRLKEQLESANERRILNYDSLLGWKKRAEVVESRLAKVQARLDVTEAILCDLFPEVDDSEVFKRYCKLCAEDDDCEWGDNFPHCFIEKDVGVVGEAQRT